MVCGHVCVRAYNKPVWQYPGLTVACVLVCVSNLGLGFWETMSGASVSMGGGSHTATTMDISITTTAPTTTASTATGIAMETSATTDKWLEPVLPMILLLGFRRRPPPPPPPQRRLFKQP